MFNNMANFFQAKCIQSTRWDPGTIAIWQSLRAGDPSIYNSDLTWGRQVAIFSALNESVTVRLVPG